jgi:GNAT superfamily N-acetyltransferase
MSGTRSAIDIRQYRDEDEPAVLELLNLSLGGGPAGRRPPEFFEWKHTRNPFGRSYAIVAEREGQMIGFRTFMRWRFLLDGAPVTAVRAVDTATHPDAQGKGVFTRLTLAALEELKFDTDLVFNTPNGKSLPGYLKMGWRRVMEVPIRVRVRRPLRFARLVGTRDQDGQRGGPPRVSALSAAELLIDDAALAPLLCAPPDGRLATDRSPQYLRWRYGDAPILDYRAVSVGHKPEGIALFRVRPRGRLWETTVAEILVAPGDVGSARRVLAAAARAARVDHVTCSLPAGSEGLAAARRAGFLPSPEGMTLVANPLRPARVDPLDPASWSLSLGDLEVF